MEEPASEPPVAPVKELPAAAAEEQPAAEGAPVEIHPPHGPIHSVRDFLLQLVTITAGVLIALSLEGLLEWTHYRTLVREARSTIAQEIDDNRKEVEIALASLDTRKKNLNNALRFATEILDTGRSDIRELNVGFAVAELSTASWESAAATGALAHMDYAEVRRYSRLYGVQDLYAAQQRRTLERVTAALTIVADGDDPHLAAPRDLEVFRQQVLGLRADLAVEEQIGRHLSEIYARALQE